MKRPLIITIISILLWLVSIVHLLLAIVPHPER